ncbi:hypothetical protein [Hymenobacter norwichensis]|uniref:hypothetical protein n=1 Tax=Hymenobacter norwichensis TaxID=223903 RepID=UPI0003B5B468|nr:hypothetical protein [Hymenobacter norwichensis]
MHAKASVPSLRWLVLVGYLLFIYTPYTRAQLLSDGYRDLIVVKNQVWGLTESGHIKVYKSTGEEVKVDSVSDASAELITNAGNDVVVQTGTKIQQWSSTDSTWRVIGSLRSKAFALVVNSKHHVFAITDKGVLDVATNKTLLPASSPNDQLTKLTSLRKPTTWFLDRQDNLWLGFGYGEWGGNVFTYDTQNHRFIDLKFHDFQINLHPIKSFFHLKSSVGFSSGMQHMMNSGAIGEFNNFNARTLYDTRADRDTSTTKQPFVIHPVPYIGPAVYEPETDHIYFYSSLGVFEGKYSGDLSRLTNWKKLFEPKLHWRIGQPDAVGSPMNVLKMLSLGNGKLVLLTQNDGVGIWDGQAFKLL